MDEKAKSEEDSLDPTLDPEQGNLEPEVPSELIEVYEINEWLEAIGESKLEAPS